MDLETGQLAGVLCAVAAHRGGNGTVRPAGSAESRKKATMNLRNGRPGTESIDVVVVGAGQAGLAVSYLRSFDIEHVVLERGGGGESWRSARWDSFTLVTPSWMTRLPGHLLAAGTGAGFVSRDAVVSLLERFAGGLPVREASRSSRFRPAAAATG
jgi:hypothetical protein